MSIHGVNDVAGQNALQQNNIRAVNNQEVHNQGQGNLTINKVEKEMNEQGKEEIGYIPAGQEKKIIKAIEEANKKIQDNNKEFEFSVHQGTKQIMIKVIDKGNGKILKEFPPEKILDMVANMCEAAGIFVDEKR